MIARIATIAAAAGVLASAAAFSWPVKAQEGLTYEASSPWNMRYDEDMCRLVREFGPNSEHLLLIDQTGPEPFYNITYIGARAKAMRREFATIQFGPAEEPTRRSFITGELPDERPLVTMHGVTLAPVAEKPDGEAIAIGPEREAAIESIAISRSGSKVVELRTGSMKEPLDAMRTCVADLANYLMKDEDSGAQPPTPKNSPGSWVTDDDYPTEMIRRNEEGVVAVRLTVDASGRATACHVKDSTRPQTFDDVVCLAILKRAKFNPALDAEGNPRAAYFMQAFKFEIP